MLYEIGSLVTDDDGNSGVVCIKWNDGDICTIENDAAHPNPRHLSEASTRPDKADPSPRDDIICGKCGGDHFHFECTSR